MTRVLITGGSGFLGREIVKCAKAEGYEVVAPSSAQLNLLTNEGADDFMRQTKGIDVIVHSAAYYGGIGITTAEPAHVFQRNVQMGLNVFELARKYNVGKVIPIGSACSYPGYLNGDLKEAELWAGPLHESVEAYGFSKKVLLVGQKAYYKQYKIKGNHLILTNLYGPHDVFTEYRSHVLSALIKKFSDAKDEVVLWGDGSPVREFLYVSDAAAAIVKSIKLEHDLEPINIGTGVGTSIRELAQMIAELIKFQGRIVWDSSKPNGATRKVLDVQRMRSALQWYPTWSLQKGLEATINWYLQNKTQADIRQ